MNIQTHCREAAKAYELGFKDASDLYLKDITKLISKKRCPSPVLMPPVLEECTAEFNKADKKGFVAGLGFALAWLKKWHGLGTEIEELYMQAGFKFKDYEKVCDEYDLPEIEEIAKAAELRNHRK